MRYDITVITLMSAGGKRHFADHITFYDVGDEVRDFVAGSCKTVLGKLMRLPEDTSEDAYVLQYRTKVVEAGTDTIVSDTKMITFPAMDQAGAVLFKQLAIEELALTAELINEHLGTHTPATKRRSGLLTFLNMVFTRQA